MASGREIKAGRAFVELGINDKLTAGLKRAAARMKAFGAGIRSMGLALAGFGAAGLTSLGATAKLFSTMGSDIFDASKRTGVAVEQLSALKFAAEQSGAGLGELEAGLRRMSRTIFDAREGSKEATESLTELGLTLADLEGLSPDEQFKLIAAQLVKVTDETNRAALAQKLFGRGGTALLPMIDNLEATLKRARELGIVISSEDAKAADLFGDSLNEIWQQAKTVLFQVGGAVAAIVQPYMEGATRVMRATIDWIKANRGLVVTIGAVAAGLTAAGAAFIVLGASISGLGVVLGVAASGIGLVVTALGALLSPIGLVIAGLGVLATWFVTSTKTGGEALAWLGDRFNDLKATAMSAFGAIADALQGGEVGLAAKILWTNLKLAWATGITALQTMWIKFTSGISQVLVAAFSHVQTKWVNLVSQLHKDLLTVSDQIGSVFRGAKAAVSDMTDELDEQAQLTGVKFAETTGEITPEEATRKRGEIAQKFQAKKDARFNQEISTEAAAQARLAKDLAAIEADRSATLSAIQHKEQELAAAEKTRSDAEVAALEGELKTLREELGMLRMAAGSAAALAGSGTVPGGPASPEFEDTASAIRAGVEKGLASIGDLPGIFNARALQSLMGGGTASERTADASEETARNTRKLLNKKLAFA